ncbi:MAG: hypothetical protein WKG07_39250 [Hymenobacter sp.]
MMRKTAKIGYEGNIKGALLAPPPCLPPAPPPDVAAVRQHPEQLHHRGRPQPRRSPTNRSSTTPCSSRCPSCASAPGEIPTGQPVLVHCAGGYRSAAGASIIAAGLPGVAVL